VATYDYSRLLTKADALITRFGKTITLVKMSENPTDPAKPWLGTADTENVLSATAVVLNDAETDDHPVSSVPDGRKAAAGMRMLISPVAAGAEDLQTYDFANVDGRLRRITRSEQLDPGGMNLLYTLELD
jgi:hypothetical protein